MLQSIGDQDSRGGHVLTSNSAPVGLAFAPTETGPKVRNARETAPTREIDPRTELGIRILCGCGRLQVEVGDVMRSVERETSSDEVGFDERPAQNRDPDHVNRSNGSLAEYDEVKDCIA